MYQIDSKSFVGPRILSAEGDCAICEHGNRKNCSNRPNLSFRICVVIRVVAPTLWQVALSLHDVVTSEGAVGKFDKLSFEVMAD